ncbi:hypothetical protein QTP88_012199 [Uroleucon formosanum]
MELAENLIKENQNVTLKQKGSPRAATSSAEENLDISSTSKLQKVDSNQPTNDVRKDKFDYFPGFDTKDHTSRCKNPMCKRKTHILHKIGPK